MLVLPLCFNRDPLFDSSLHESIKNLDLVRSVGGDRDHRSGGDREHRSGGGGILDRLGPHPSAMSSSSMYGNTYGLSPQFLESLGIDGPLHTRVFVANVSSVSHEKKLTLFLWKTKVPFVIFDLIQSFL